MNLDFSRRRQIGPQLVLYVVVAALLIWVFIAMATDRSPEERSHMMRIWTLCGAAVMAVATPHILFPDPEFRRLLLIAPSPAFLLARMLRRASPLLLLALAPCLVTAFFRAANAAATAAVLLCGIWLLAVVWYIRLGSRSQQWQEGIRGGWYRRSYEYLSVPPALPAGAMPMMLTTTAVFAVGIGAVLAWSAVRGGGAGTIILPALAVFAAGMAETYRLHRQADVQIFHSQAFFDELLRMYGSVRTEGRDALAFASVYWVPRRLKPATWALLVQMDRRVPLGRLVIAGHFLFWLLMWNQGYGAAAVGYLLLFSIAKNAAPGLVGGRDASPPAFNLLVQPAADWIWARTFASLRWILPWVLSLIVVGVFSTSFPIFLVVMWAAIDAALAVVASSVITLLTEYRYRHALA